MAAYTVTRRFYGLKGYQHLWHYASPTAGTLPAIVYCPGGGWKGAQKEAWEIEPMWTYGLSNQDNAAYVHKYHVFVVNTAAIGYEGLNVFTRSNWADATAYAVGDEVHRSGLRYQCRDAHTSDLAGAVNPPGTGSSWTDYWHKMSRSLLAWSGSSVAYTVDTQVSNASRQWQCVAAHTSGAGTEPGVGGSWATAWRELGVNEANFRQSEDRSETTPGFLDESIQNVQAAMAWVKRNAAAYSVDPNKIILMGSSAGGQRAGCAAYWYSAPWTSDAVPYTTRASAPMHDARPAAVCLGITPVDIRLHTANALSLLNGLWGRDLSDANLVGLTTAERDSMSPMRVLKRTGLTVPTYLNYVGSRHDDTSAATVWATNTYHHALNGWLMLQALTDASPNGFGETDGRHRLIETSATASSLDVYTDYNGTKTTTAYTTLGLTIANDFFAWAAARLGL